MAPAALSLEHVVFYDVDLLPVLLVDWLEMRIVGTNVAEVKWTWHVPSDLATNVWNIPAQGKLSEAARD